MRTSAIKIDPTNASGFAEVNRRTLVAHEIVTISVIGGPGCGKTTLIDATIEIGLARSDGETFDSGSAAGDL